ncbi:MAG: hypothetical protein RL417_2498 [Pseudomonadota bacterium]|jgi:hypothetical protein
MRDRSPPPVRDQVKKIGVGLVAKSAIPRCEGLELMRSGIKHGANSVTPSIGLV